MAQRLLGPFFCGNSAGPFLLHTLVTFKYGLFVPNYSSAGTGEAMNFPILRVEGVLGGKSPLCWVSGPSFQLSMWRKKTGGDEEPPHRHRIICYLFTRARISPPTRSNLCDSSPLSCLSCAALVKAFIT